MAEPSVLVPFGIAVFLAANMGASGVAPAFAAAFAARLVSRGLMVALFGLFVVLGAVLSGGKVLSTISGGVVPSAAMGPVVVSVVLLATAVSMFLANLLHVPQSTSQSTVFALMGAAIALGVFEPRSVFVKLMPAWFLLPVVAFVVTYVVARLVVLPGFERQGIRWDRVSAHGSWRWIGIAFSCYVAYAIGSNNVANVAGPLYSLVSNEADPGLGAATTTLLSIMAVMMVAPWFGIGAAMLGRGPVETAGARIGQLGPSGAAFSAFVTATLLLLASVTRGIPTSLVQLNAATVIAITMAKEGPRRALADNSVPRLATVWLVAPVLSFATCFGLTHAALAAGWIG